MPDESSHEEQRLIQSGFEDRLKHLFSVLAEGLATGEDETRCKDRFRRALRSAKKARALALEAAADEETAPTPEKELPINIAEPIGWETEEGATS